MLSQAAALAFWSSASFVIYTYVAYPCIIALAARLRPRPVRRSPDHTPPLCVVIAARNEAARIESRIANLLEQDYPEGAVRIVVVSDGSTDDTPQVLESLAAREPRLRAIIASQHGGKAAALNAGIDEARGELIVFADARQRFASDALRRLAENFADPEVGCVSGELELTSGSGVAADVGLYWSYEKWMRRNESACGSMLGATGAIYAIRRALWRPLPGGTLLDDFLTPLRIVLAGHRAIFDGRALATDQAAQRADREFRRKARTLAGNFQAFASEPAMLSPARHPLLCFQVWSHKLFRLIVPWMLLVLLAASCLARGLFYDLALAAQLAFYAAAALGALQERRAAAIPWRAISFAYTFVTLNAAAIAGLWLWLSGVESRRVWRR